MEAEAKHDFVPGDPATELAFKKGDRLLILNFGDPVQWYSAQKNGQTGLVPGNYIEVRNAEWYYGRISRLTAENVLMSSAHHEGAFLVRLSESSPNDFSLSVKCGEAVQHFRILKSREHRYFLWTTEFDSINALVEHYKTESVSKSKPIYLRDMDSETFMAEAIYDFEPKDDAEDGETELGFKKGDLIQVFDCRDENWWGGRIGERTGFFPKLYVKKQDLRPFKN